MSEHQVSGSLRNDEEEKSGAQLISKRRVNYRIIRPVITEMKLKKRAPNINPTPPTSSTSNNVSSPAPCSSRPQANSTYTSPTHHPQPPPPLLLNVDMYECIYVPPPCPCTNPSHPTPNTTQPLSTHQARSSPHSRTSRCIGSSARGYTAADPRGS